MTRRQIETSREMRLWIGQVLVPAFALTMAIPEARDAVKEKANSLIRSLKKKEKKEES